MVTVSSVVSSLLAAAIWFVAGFIVLRLWGAYRRLEGTIENWQTLSQELVAASTDVEMVDDALSVLNSAIEWHRHMAFISGLITICAVVILAAILVVMVITPTWLFIVLAVISAIVAFLSFYVCSVPCRTVFRLQGIVNSALSARLDGRIKSKSEQRNECV